MGIYDAMQMCRADVSTVCMGLAASMGAFLLASGANGKRLSMPNARIMIHQPLGGASGQAVDIEIQAKEIMYHKANLNRLMAFHTGQDVKQVDEDTDRDRYMSPLEAAYNHEYMSQIMTWIPVFLQCIYANLATWLAYVWMKNFGNKETFRSNLFFNKRRHQKRCVAFAYLPLGGQCG